MGETRAKFAALVFGGIAMTTLAGAATAERKLESPQDENAYLEEVESPRAIEWVKARNHESEAAIQASPDYRDIEADIRSEAFSPDRLAHGTIRNGYVYNFWQDDAHERGIWRRATIAEYARPKPQWELLLDLDALAKAEGENWVWREANCLPGTWRLCLLTLSRGGKDASVAREFDLEKKAFVANGFSLPEAKSIVSWRDENSLWVGTDFGPGTLTKSGYPRQARVWARGEKLENTKIVYEVPESDMAAEGSTWFRPEGQWSFVKRTKDFYSGELFRVSGEMKLEKVPVPGDAILEEIFRGWMLFSLRTAWKGASWDFPAGSLVALSLENKASAPELVYRPGPRASLISVTATRSRLLLDTLENVHGRILSATRGPSGWAIASFGLPKSGSSLQVSAASSFDDRALFYETGFLAPPAILSGDASGDVSGSVSGEKPKLARVHSLPERFDATGLVVEQLEAISKDGTKIPYFVARPRDLAHNGQAPTLLYGYGGFEISLTPEYLGAIGKAWLKKRGAVYVVANIRGGGEFGPQWHQAAILENRQRAYDDFAAVAEDLIARKITSPPRLGIMGGSNGGLLVGVAYTQRPELFGAVVCKVPLLDMLRYHQLLAGNSWMAEYGNPDDPKMAKIIGRYSPYQNVRAQASYPPILFMTSTKDDRVHPGHARKMMAKLAGLGKPALLWENMEGGHAGAANLEQRVRFSSLAWTFLWQVLSKPPGAVPQNLRLPAQSH
jgi:prolyl oligopeptidase